MPRNILFGLIAAVAAALGLATGALLLSPKAVPIDSGTVLDSPRPLPDFALTGDNGQPFTPANLQGRWTLAFPGFTSCPDVCPATFALLDTVVKKLGPAGENLDVLLISVDPERDTPERLGRFVQHFNPRFRAATGPNAQLDALAAAMSFVYVKVPGSTPETYTMDHSTALMLINPDGQLAAFFTAPHRPDVLAADLKTLLGKTG